MHLAPARTLSAFTVIERVETMLVDLPTIRPHKLSVATMNTQTLVLVRLTCGDGIIGWGEATTIGGLAYGEESPESIKANIDTHIAPLLLGMDGDNVAACMQRLRKAIQGNRFAKCAIETALMDAKGKFTTLSTERVCPSCTRAFDAPDPRMFSFHSPHGWCEECRGFGAIWQTEYTPKQDESVSQAERELAGGELVQVRVGQAHARDRGPGVGHLEREVGRELVLHRHVPLLHVTGSEVAVHREHALAEAGRRGEWKG